jgi:pimeloyl-ACP methyl ester carboxylesterase
MKRGRLLCSDHDEIGVAAMSEPFGERNVQCAGPGGLHRMAYLEWGQPDNPRVVVCVHGLTRCARDFDFLARALAPHYRVVCPDVAGRGDSDWLSNPMDYRLPVYVGDMVTLIARLDVESVHWVGTSLGGLIGMTLAALPDSVVTKLVLNDVGPVLTATSLARIGAYVGKWPPLPTIEAAETYVRTVSAPFGPHSDAEWRFLTEHVVRKNRDGTLRMHYDPAIAAPFEAEPLHNDVALWGLYDGLRCPTVVLRGEQSDLLTRETAARMSKRGPKAKVVEFPGVGHAPTLIHQDQIDVVQAFLLES